MGSLDLMDVYDACEAKWRHLGWSALSDIERVIVLVVDFYYQVEAHGIRGYYRNPEGSRAAETVLALEEAGVTSSASALRRCNALFPGGQPPTNQTERASEAARLYHLSDSSMKSIEEEYAPQHESMYSLAERFVAGHEQEFRRLLSGH
jgi:hypothetical protein